MPEVSGLKLWHDNYGRQLGQTATCINASSTKLEGVSGATAIGSQILWVHKVLFNNEVLG